MKKLSKNTLLENIFVSNDNTDIRAKIKSLIGYDIPNIVRVWAENKGYWYFKDKDILDELLKANILDDEFQKLLISLKNIKSTQDRLTKSQFIDLLKTLFENTGMSEIVPYTNDIITHIGFFVYLCVLSGISIRPFNFMLLKAKYQQKTYKDPKGNDINGLEYTAHIKFKGLKLNAKAQTPSTPIHDAFGRF